MIILQVIYYINLLECFSQHYKLIAIDLSKQIKLENPDLKRQINFFVKMIEIMRLHCSLSLKNQKKSLLNFNNILQLLFDLVLKKASYIIETQKIVNLLNDFDNESSNFAVKMVCHLWSEWCRL